MTGEEECILNQIAACLSRGKMKRRGKAEREKDYQPRILNDTSEQCVKAFCDNCPLSRNESLGIYRVAVTNHISYSEEYSFSLATVFTRIDPS